jgi:hypothetical protein
MLTQPIPISTRASRIDAGLRPSGIPAPRSTGQTGRIIVSNRSGITIWTSRRGWPIPFIIPDGQTATIESIAGSQEIISVWNCDGRGPVRHRLDQATVHIVAGMDRRVRWTGYGFKEE